VLGGLLRQEQVNQPVAQRSMQVSHPSWSLNFSGVGLCDYSMQTSGQSIGFQIFKMHPSWDSDGEE